MRQAFAVLLIACTLGALLPASALADTAADSEPAIHPVVASYASDYSVTLAEAQRRLERIPALQDIIGALHSLEADRLAGWGIDHHGPMTAWVWLTGSEPPSSAAAEIADAHSDVKIRTGAKFTFAALTAAQDKFGIGEGIGPVGNTGAADAVQIDISDLITHTAVDVRANALEIGIDTSSAPAPPSGALDALEGRGPFGPVGSTGDAPDDAGTLAIITALLAPHIAVPYNVIKADAIEDQTAFEGGHRMTNGSAVCTSGFTAYHSNHGRYGIITAGHCRRSTWTTQGVALTFGVRAYNASNDAAFYLIPRNQAHTATNRILCSNHPENPRTCAVRSIGPGRLLMLDDHVCRAGTNSGVSCGTVDNVRFQPSSSDGCDGYGGTCQAVFVRASGPNVRSCKGDSGGPVYSYSAAYGIHKAGPEDNPCNKSNSFIVFSSIRRVQNALGVTVVTNWPEDVP
ncbi:trypsin-like serine protease [Candidatus Poriferisodalis sp.]|uniref:trypsin-like serine protease n=1 Tax=Candidatus Poriferisodalis sp. TaxID=3101277 RepID=UPI003B010727